VKVGLFYDLRNPSQWARPWPEFYVRTLDSLANAEAMGLDAAWFTEHHLFDDGYQPQPLTFLAAVAARTSRISLGTAVLLAALRPAVLVAEEVAVVDQISGGRLQLGICAGYSPREYALYGKDLSKRYGLTDAAVAEIRHRAGRLGVGLLSLDRSLLVPYREGLVEGGHDPAIARTAGMLDIIVADDPEATLVRIAPHYAHQLNTYRHATVAGSDAPAPREITVDKLLSGSDGKGSIPGLRVLTPADAIDAIRAETADAPVEHVYLWASVAGMPDDLVERHVQLLCTEVRPQL